MQGPSAKSYPFCHVLPTRTGKDDEDEILGFIRRDRRLPEGDGACGAYVCRLL